jgi:hypothetical protein
MSTVTSEKLQLAKDAIRMFSIWRGVQRRCYSPIEKRYDRYGGRGISAEWKSFEDFFIDMYPTYSSELSLDRIDNDGNYSATNCRWATPKQQANNTSKNVRLTHNNITMTKTEWAEYLNMGVSTLNQRLGDYGWSIEKALSTPVHKRAPNQCVEGHPYDETTRRKDGRGNHCKTCRKNKQMKARI